MMTYNSSTQYGSVSKVFHWLIFLLVTPMVIGGFFMGDMPADYKPFIYNTHKLVGLTVLLLMVLRIVWALMNVKPSLAADTPFWQRLAAYLTHRLLYVFIVLMPLAGWIGSSAVGKGPHLGSLSFNLPIPENKVLTSVAFDLHELFAFIIIALISIHVLGALYHYLIKKDNILQRML